MLTRLVRQPYWPKRWTVSDGAIYYQTREDDRHLWDDKKWFKLGRTEPEAFSTWYGRNYRPPDAPSTISECFDIFEAEHMAKLAEATQKDYRDAIAKMRPAIGHIPPQRLKPSHVYTYMSKRPDVAGNREKAVLSSVLTKVAIRRGVIDQNPCREVERNEEESRDRYVTDHELARFYKRCTPELQCRVDILMATGMRPGQLRALTLFAWDGGEGLTVPKAKKGRTVRYKGDNLTEAIERLLALRKGKRKNSEYLFPTRSGRMFTPDGWRMAWQNTMRKYAADGFERFQERDLRAKVASDSDTPQEANQRLAHQSMTTTNKHYIRGVQHVTTLNRKGKPDL